jgi:3D (Asp-Asp-Asp) domain-containing protein
MQAFALTIRNTAFDYWWWWATIRNTQDVVKPRVDYWIPLVATMQNIKDVGKIFIIVMMFVSISSFSYAAPKHAPRPYKSVFVVAKVTAYANDSGSINYNPNAAPGHQGKAVPDGITATGKKVQHGICAADWKHYKPGTKIYIPGYGMCSIQDKGGKVKGVHFDVFFDSKSEAFQWGVKKVEVLVFSK